MKNINKTRFYNLSGLSKFLFCFILITLFSCGRTESFLLESPDKHVQVHLSNNNSIGQFSVVFQGVTLLASSKIGLMVNKINGTKDVSFSELSKESFDNTWNTVNGKQSTIHNYYNQFRIGVSKKASEELLYEIIFRLYNDGFAYRYEFTSESMVSNGSLIDNELTNLRFNDDFRYWAYNGERHNLGPNKRSGSSLEKVRLPLVVQTNKDKFIGIHESEILSHAPFTINASSNSQTLSFNTDYSSQDQPYKTSWRTFILGNKIGDLVESNIIVNLNEPCKIEDPSWIKPGKSLWDWRIAGYEAEDDFVYGLNTVTHKRMIDFAANNNIQYLLIDADWYGEEFDQNSDPTSSGQHVNIEECMSYAKDKGIGVILYLNDIGAKKFGLERVLKQFSDWGAVGVKYGFMTGKGEAKVQHTRKVVELCAKYRLMVNFHDGPVAPSGDRRTWPNLVTKEYGHAQADARRSYYPETAVNTVLINMISGPLDMTNGWFGLNKAHSREKVFKVIPGTVAAEVAKLIAVYSGWMVLPDSPDEYLKKDDLFECVRQMPTQFDSFQVLDARLDEFVTVARKAGDNWFVGSLTNREARNLTIDLSFLPKDQSFEATLYEDAEDSHFLTNKEVYGIRKIEVTSESQLTVKLVEGGGNAIFLKKK
ncbi:glycoside hydrolase family 97 protein [Seonamhaeicola maritimus]|uniref:Glycoside hydrolase family 97 protein n=1 Tax=Seonamhaeicola maritimus TaxID=2591822 RepID=A0A5C7GL76_9FLAO|nr:glycoside hydrolase family 97 protein [Seonamhaeicola maritimus]TXG39053.1 glycoside hydrolase family 97 protein [Seonamhaeicola maritimus]